MGVIADRLKTLAIDAARDFIRERRAERNGTPRTAPLTPAEETEAQKIADNETNNEGLVNSRTFMGGLTAFLTSAGAFWAEMQSADGFDLEIGGPLLGTAIASLVVMIGRAKSGLTAIDWKRPWTIFGLGR